MTKDKKSLSDLNSKLGEPVIKVVGIIIIAFVAVIPVLVAGNALIQNF